MLLIAFKVFCIAFTFSFIVSFFVSYYKTRKRLKEEQFLW